MFSFFKRRDATIYPADPLGDALYEQFPDPARIPDTVALWFDLYFKSQSGADRMAAFTANQRVAVQRDHDPSMQGEPTPDGKDMHGPWNVEFELPVKGRHRDLQLVFREVDRTARDYGGQIGGWLIVLHEPDATDHSA